MLQAISWHSRSCHRIWNSSLREQSQRKMWSAEACLFLEWGGEASQQPNALPSIVSSHVSQWCPSSFNIFGMILEDEEAVFGFPSLHFAQPLKPLSAAQAWLEGNCLPHLPDPHLHLLFVVLLCVAIVVSYGIFWYLDSKIRQLVDLLGSSWHIVRIYFTYLHRAIKINPFSNSLGSRAW